MKTVIYEKYVKKFEIKFQNAATPFALIWFAQEKIWKIEYFKSLHFLTEYLTHVWITTQAITDHGILDEEGTRYEYIPAAIVEEMPDVCLTAPEAQG